jgi:DNA-binding transcriptional LysR family regulator
MFSLDRSKDGGEKMNLYQLYYFKTLAKLEHYTKAAEELSLTQPSLSHAISSLESELDVLLFEKHGRNIRLTEYGKTFLAYVESALEELEAGTKKVREIATERDANISLGFIYTLSSRYIPKLISSFKKYEQNKHINFSLKEGWSREACTISLVKSLKEGKFDAIFVSLIPNDPEIDFIPIYDQNLVVLLSKENPLAKNNSIDLKDTESYPIIQYSGKIGLRDEINRLFEKVNITPNIGYEIEDELAMAGLVAANLGIAIVPENVNILKNKDVVVRPIHNPVYIRKIYMGLCKNRQLSSSLQRFKDYVIRTSYFGDKP